MRRPKALRRVVPRDILERLSPGDLVVHIDHGVARYEQMLRRGGAGDERDYLELSFAGGDRIFVPVEQIARVTRYAAVDVDEAAPAAEPRRIAHRLDWQPWTAGTPGTDTGSVAVVGSGTLAAALRAAVETEAEVTEARTVVYVADSDGPSAQDTAVRLTTEVGELVATLADREPRHPATLWVITHGVFESATESALRQSPLWGLAGVIGAEQPHSRRREHRAPDAESAGHHSGREPEPDRQRVAQR